MYWISDGDGKIDGQIDCKVGFKIKKIYKVIFINVNEYLGLYRQYSFYIFYLYL